MSNPYLEHLTYGMMASYNFISRKKKSFLFCHFIGKGSPRIIFLFTCDLSRIIRNLIIFNHYSYVIYPQKYVLQ